MRNTYNTCIPLVAHYVSEPLRGTVCNPPSAYLDAPAPRKPLPPSRGGVYPHPPSAEKMAYTLRVSASSRH